jgi:hypothetical protein
MLATVILLFAQLQVPVQEPPPPMPADTISTSELHTLYARIFRPERGEYEGQFYYSLSVDADSLLPEHPLTGFVRENEHFLLYLALHATQPSFTELVEDEPSLFLLKQRYQQRTVADPVFSRVIAPTLARYLSRHNIVLAGVEVPAAVPEHDLRTVIDVAARFFYPDAVLPDGRLQSHICVGVNGMLDYVGERDLVLEAFAFSAVFRDLLASKHDVEQDYRKAKALMNSMNLSSDPQVRLARAQGVMWGAMVGSERLRSVLLEEVQHKQSYLPLAIRTVP